MAYMSIQVEEPLIANLLKSNDSYGASIRAVDWAVITSILSPFNLLSSFKLISFLLHGLNLINV